MTSIAPNHRNFKHRIKGQTAVLFTLAVVTILGAMALTADVTVAYYNFERIQQAADAAALAGAAQLYPNPPPPPLIAAGCEGGSEAEEVACTYATLDGALASEVTTALLAPSGAETLQVSIQRNNIPVFFASLLGRTLPSSAKASATSVGPNPIGAVHNGLFPAAMPPNPNGGALAFGTQINLTENYSSGNFGWLDIPIGFHGATGASSALHSSDAAANLNTNIASGCACDLAVNDWLYPLPGQSFGAISAAVATRANGSTLPPALAGNEPQLVTVPVVDWSTSHAGSSAVRLTGFAMVWLVGISNSAGAATLTVQFVQFVSRYASAGGGPTDYGAYMRPYLVQ
ncbi:MAG: pilus assembly protein TadG-related protein [Candidatus Binataceae bacterium]